MELKKCQGYYGKCYYSEDMMVPVDMFSTNRSSKDGLHQSCKRCNVEQHKLADPKSNAISREAYKRCGGQKQYFAMSKAERMALRAEIKREGVGKELETNVIPMFKRDEPVGAPMRTREPSEMQGEFIPQGWVYVVKNPDIPDIIKIGKTYPDGIGSIMSSARRFGRAILVEKHYFDEAEKAEKGIQNILRNFNMRVLGYEDCGKELFQCSINCFRKALLEYQQELENDTAVSEG